MDSHPNTSRYRRAGMLCALTLTWASMSAAQSSSTDKSAALRQHAAGVEAFSAGHYKTAIEAFRQADRLQPSPPIAYNIARAYEKLGDSTSALAAYREYLRRADPAPDRARVERHIAELERRLAAREVRELSARSETQVASRPVIVVAAKPESESGTESDSESVSESESGSVSDSESESESESESGSESAANGVDMAAAPKLSDEPAESAPVHFKSRVSGARHRAARGHASSTLTAPLGIAALGTAAATLGAAGIFELLRRDAQHDALVASTQIDFAQQRERMDDRQTVARVLLGVSGGLAITGVALLIAHAGEETGPARGSADDDGLQAALAVTPTAAKVRVWTHF